MNTKLTKTTVVSLVAVAIAFGMSGMSGTMQATPPTPGCSAQTLRGSYLFAAHGWNIVGGVAQPKAIVEHIEFNGDGTLVVPFATVSINGTIIRSGGSVVSFYTVEADCTGTLTFTGGPSFDIFVQPGDGKMIWMIQTGPAVAPPAVLEGTATKVSP